MSMAECRRRRLYIHRDGPAWDHYGRGAVRVLWQSREYYAFLQRFVERRDSATSNARPVHLIPVLALGSLDPARLWRP